jgi:2-polyprenyl-6-methoxyphenol hydroxylase-like FAD-dependent oxidoreductase
MIGGGLIGCETGLWLASHNHEVHILEMRQVKQAVYEGFCAAMDIV